VQHSIVFSTVRPSGANLKTPDFPHTYNEYAVTSTNDIVDRLRDATIAIINKVPMREATLCAASQPKLIAVADRHRCRR
jgi:glycerate dehydrogenase